MSCESCKSDKGVKDVQWGVFIFGIYLFGAAIYGTIELFKNLMSLIK